MQFCLLDSPQKCYNCINRTSIFFQHPKEVFVCSLIVSLRCVFWVAPSIRGGGNGSPRPASQRAAAFILTAAMLTTLAAPAFAKTWHIEDGDITVKAGETKGTNKVSQGANQEVEDTDTIITNQNKDTASSNTVTIDAGSDKVEVTLQDVNIKADSGSALTSKGDVTLTLKGENHLTGGNGSGNSSGGSGIHSRSDIDLSGSLELTAKAGSPNGKALSQNGIELDPNTFKEKLDPGANIITKDADGKVINQVSIPRPVEPEGPVIPEESSSSFDSGSSTPSADGGSATPSAPASPLPGLTVTDKDGQRISYTSIRGNNVLSIRAGRFTASLRVSLAALRQLRAEGIDTITFRTVLCSTTLSVDELLAIGGEDAEVVLTHHTRSSTLTVGGKAV